jgi:hypothetical protein
MLPANHLEEHATTHGQPETGQLTDGKVKHASFHPVKIDSFLL